MDAEVTQKDGEEQRNQPVLIGILLGLCGSGVDGGLRLALGAGAARAAEFVLGDTISLSGAFSRDNAKCYGNYEMRIQFCRCCKKGERVGLLWRVRG